MRRGLLSWSHDEVAPAVFEARIARTQAAMSEANLDALLIYTNFPRPAAVSYLTHFVPYWNECVLVLLPWGLPTLFAGLSKRMSGWISETAHLADVVCTPRIGKGLQALIAGEVGNDAKLGVVELSKVPMPLLAPLTAEGMTLQDQTQLFEIIRNPADDAEIAQAERAAFIARSALAGAEPHRGVTAILTEIERTARMAGAEEVLVDVAENLDLDPRLRRAERNFELGDRYALRISIAYKGNWVRYGRSYERGNAGSRHVSAVEDTLTSCIPGLSDGSKLTAWPNKPPLAVSDVVVEGAHLGTPLIILDPPASGAVVSVGMTISDRRGCWLVTEPVLLGTNGHAVARALGLGN